MECHDSGVRKYLYAAYGTSANSTNHTNRSAAGHAEKRSSRSCSEGDSETCRPGKMILRKGTTMKRHGLILIAAAFCFGIILIPVPVTAQSLVKVCTIIPSTTKIGTTQYSCQDVATTNPFPVQITPGLDPCQSPGVVK